MKLNDTISIRGTSVSDLSPTYIIAEMACAHQGDIGNAFELIDTSVAAKADFIQFQIFTPSANMAPTSKNYRLLQDLEFSKSQWVDLAAYARQQDIHLSIFVYDEPSLELALTLQPDMLKLNSSELSNPHMLDGAASSGLPFTMGTGASSHEEISAAIDRVLSKGARDVILMHGMQNFPTELSDANLRRIRKLKDDFDALVIFADHTSPDHELALWIDLAAIGMGASLLEKHIVLDRSKGGVDWQSALEPHEFMHYVRMIRESQAAFGSYEFTEFTESERNYRQFQKKSLVSARDIKAGETLEVEDVMFLRVQGQQEGISPMLFRDVALGRCVNRDIRKFEQILPPDLS